MFIKKAAAGVCVCYSSFLAHDTMKTMYVCVCASQCALCKQVFYILCADARAHNQQTKEVENKGKKLDYTPCI